MSIIVKVNDYSYDFESFTPLSGSRCVEEHRYSPRLRTRGLGLRRGKVTKDDKERSQEFHIASVVDVVVRGH